MPVAAALAAVSPRSCECWRPSPALQRSGSGRRSAPTCSGPAGRMPSGLGASRSLPAQAAWPAGTDALGSAAAATGARRRANLKLSKARRRTAMMQAAPLALSRLTAAELQSVSAPTRLAYAGAYSAMEEWSRTRRMPLDKAAQVDSAVTMFLDHLFKCGESSAKANYAVFGTIFCRGLGRGPQSLPRARGALRGFTRDDPPCSRDPMPLEVMSALAFWMSQRNELESKAAAMALVTSFDLFTRPSETLAIKAEDIVAPGIGRYAETSVIVAPILPGDSTQKPAASRSRRRTGTSTTR